MSMLWSVQNLVLAGAAAGEFAEIQQSFRWEKITPINRKNLNLDSLS